MQFISTHSLSNEQSTGMKSFLNRAIFSKVISNVKQRVTNEIHHIEIDASSASIAERSLIIIGLNYF